MLERIFRFDAGDQKASITFRNTMLGDIRFVNLLDQFVTDDMPDGGFRSKFCWVVSYVETFEGFDWDVSWRDAPTPETFEDAYRGLARLMDRELFQKLIEVVDQLKNRQDKIEKPDSALTDMEKADPN
jgi:hypothetical protein